MWQAHSRIIICMYFFRHLQLYSKIFLSFDFEMFQNFLKPFEKKNLKNLNTESHSNPLSHSPNANIRRINNRLYEITNRRYLWSVYFKHIYVSNITNTYDTSNTSYTSWTHIYVSSITNTYHTSNTSYTSWTQLKDDPERLLSISGPSPGAYVW